MGDRKGAVVRADAASAGPMSTTAILHGCVRDLLACIEDIETPTSVLGFAMAEPAIFLSAGSGDVLAPPQKRS